jgi:hypothetical protein
MSEAMPPKIKKFSPAKQRLLDQLLEQNAEGTISDLDKATLEALVSEAQELMIANSQRLAEFARSQSPQCPVAAVPVTVWVNPELTQR